MISKSERLNDIKKYLFQCHLFWRVSAHLPLNSNAVSGISNGYARTRQAVKENRLRLE
jgi:hypothetical protein